jgi:hypothetical protein
VIYLMRHLHRDDQGFLESFAASGLAETSAVNAIALLSRADEIAGGRTDAVDLAARIAARYEADPAVRRAAFVVRPVAALLALSASTLTQATYDVFDRVAALADEDVDRALLGVGPFREAPVPGVDDETRLDLLDRFGLMGVRLAVMLVRHGQAPSATALSDALLERSGVPQLRALFLDLFAERRHVLRARTALNLLESALAAEPGRHQDVRRQLDRIRSDAHELVELRLLEQLRLAAADAAGGAPPPAVQDEIERLIGAHGGGLARRLGRDDGASDADLHRAALDAHRRWQAVEQSPAASAELARSARVVVRSLEVALARLDAAPAGDRAAR